MVFKIATLIVLALFLGVCLLFCNSITIFLTLFAVVMLHFQILQEERTYEIIT
jgi:protein-S-isoprenylcysteine O-methyltransferase Ste14